MLDYFSEFWNLFYIKVSVQITHHVGNETEEQANQDKLAESGIPVELADPQPASSEFREGEEQVTLEYDPETQTVQIQRAETVRNSSERSFINKDIEKQECIPVGCVPPAAVAVRDQAPPCGQTDICKI